MTVSQAHNIMAVCECEQDDARAKVKRTQLAHEGTTHNTSVKIVRQMYGGHRSHVFTHYFELGMRRLACTISV